MTNDEFSHPSTKTAQKMALEDALESLSPISLEEMDNVTLLNRVDTKYVFARSQLRGLLDQLSNHYRCLTINTQRLQAYRTLYFDTKDASMYRMHHNGISRRMKVRKRWYVDSGLGFLEIKRRNNKARTVKTRTTLPGSSEEEQRDFQAWVNENLDPFQFDELRPFTWTFFNRITLVDHAGTERVTLDTDLAWSAGNSSEDVPQQQDHQTTANDFCIAELKRDGRHARTHCMKVLRENRIMPGSFSKYCVGSALIHPKLKNGVFKPTLLQLGGLDQ